MLAIFRKRTGNILFERGHVFVRCPGHEERANLGADKVIGATGAQERKILGVLRVDKLEHVGRIAEAGDPPVLGAHLAAKIRCDLNGKLLAIAAGWHNFPAEPGRAFLNSVAMNELPDLVDDGKRVQVALALRLAPGEQSVAAQHDAVATGIRFDSLAHRQSQFKAGPLPWNPNQRVIELAVELVHLGLAVAGRSQRNAPVRMEMIDMRKWQESMQRRIDRSGYGIAAESAKRIQPDHVVLCVDALVNPLQCQQLLLTERGKARALDASQVAAGTLHPQHFNGFAVQRVDFSQFGTGVAAGKVRNAKVGTEQVRAIAQQLRFIKRGGDAGIPAVFKDVEGRGSGCCQRHTYHSTGNECTTVKISRRKAIGNKCLSRILNQIRSVPSLSAALHS